MKSPPDLDPVQGAADVRYHGHRDDPAVLDMQETLLTDENLATLLVQGVTEHGRGIDNALRAELLTAEQRARSRRSTTRSIWPTRRTQRSTEEFTRRATRRCSSHSRRLRPGDVIYDRGYQSASPDLGVAKNYANEDAEPVRVIFEIEAPAGTRVVYLDHYNEHGEVEDMLPRESLLEYRGNERREDGYVYVRFEYTQEGFEYTPAGIPGDGGGGVSSQDGTGGPARPEPTWAWPPGSHG